MCSACGILRNGAEWIDDIEDEATLVHRRLALRRRRMRLINMLLDGSGVSLGEHGRQLVVRGATGSTRLVTDLAHVWRSADELGRCRVDPLSGPLTAEESGA